MPVKTRFFLLTPIICVFSLCLSINPAMADIMTLDATSTRPDIWGDFSITFDDGLNGNPSDGQFDFGELVSWTGTLVDTGTPRLYDILLAVPDTPYTNYHQGSGLNPNPTETYEWLMQPSAFPGFEARPTERLWTYSFDNTGASPIPEPTSLILLGTGLSALGLVVYRSKKK